MRWNLVATVAMLVGTPIALPVVSFAAPQDTVPPPVTAPLPRPADPLIYVQRYRGPQDEILRTLSLFHDHRAVLTTRFLNNSVALVQTGTWRNERANHFTVVLTRENSKPMTRAAISFVGTPKRGGGTISASGKNVRNYGNFGLTMVPRADDRLAYSVNAGTLRIEGVGIQPTEIPNVQAVIRTSEDDLIYWAATGSGNALYRFTALIGKPRTLAAFPDRITRVVQAHSASGRPAVIVSLIGGTSGAARVVVIDPIREIQTKSWANARFVGTSGGRIMVSMGGRSRAFALDSIL